MTHRRSNILAALACLLLAAPPAMADDIVATWASVKLPPPPALKQVKVDTAHTALLLLDFDVHVCNAETRPRCLATLPAIATLLAGARSHGVFVAYSTVLTGSIADVPPSIAPLPGDPSVRAGADKFLGTDLADRLKAKGIRTVIVTGTTAQGAALFSASAAALRGFEVVFPVDTISADDPFAELSSTWVLANAPASVGSHVTLTRSDMIGY